MEQWLGLHVFTAGGTSLIPGQGTKTLHASQYGQKEKKKKVIKTWQWHPTPVLFPGKSHGQRSLVGCSPWGRKESDTTERLHFDFSLSCTGGGNGNPLQCSCLENPRDRGAWWAAVCGVTQSWTRLKRRSSSSSSSSYKYNPLFIDEENEVLIRPEICIDVH